MAEHTNDNEIDDDNENEKKDFEGDNDFDLEKEEEEEKNYKKFEKIIENKIKEDDKNRKTKCNKKEDVHKESTFYIYDPNKEDEEINQNSVNIIVPDSIYKIIGVN